MSTLASNLFAAISAVTGLAVAASQLWAAARSQKRLVFERAHLTAARLSTALESADINALGSYLFETVGSVHLADLSRDDALQSRVATALGLIADFTSSGSDRTFAEPLEVRSSGPVRQIDELERARLSVTAGEVWNGLARARLYLERSLQSRLSIESARPLGASRLLSVAVERGEINEGDANALRYAINVANRGVHGEDIEPGIALEAIDILERVLSSSVL